MKYCFRSLLFLNFFWSLLTKKLPYAYCTLHIFDDGLELLQKIGSTGNIEISSSCAFTGCKVRHETFSSCQVSIEYEFWFNTRDFRGVSVIFSIIWIKSIVGKIGFQIYSINMLCDFAFCLFIVALLHQSLTNFFAAVINFHFNVKHVSQNWFDRTHNIIKHVHSNTHIQNFERYNADIWNKPVHMEYVFGLLRHY